MDGTANAPVTSSLSSWSCTSSFGCSPTVTEPGVFGAGPNSNLWSYPTPQVDFASIAANFSTLKSTAQSSGLYLPRVSSGSAGTSNGGRGYHLLFNSNGTVTVRQFLSIIQPSPHRKQTTHLLIPRPRTAHRKLLAEPTHFLQIADLYLWKTMYGSKE